MILFLVFGKITKNFLNDIISKYLMDKFTKKTYFCKLNTKTFCSKKVYYLHENQIFHIYNNHDSHRYKYRYSGV